MRSKLLPATLATLTIAGTVVALGSTLGEPTGATERQFPIHSIESAPAESRAALEFVQSRFEMVPHLSGVMASSPALINSYKTLQTNLEELGGLTPAENNVVQMAIAFENECQYCVAGHTMAGKMFFGSSDEELAALRTGGTLPEPKLEALRTFALQVNASQGRVTDEQLQAFLDAGYTRSQALDVVANISAKVMTNFANQLAHTPVDEPFRMFTEGLPFAEDRPVVPVSHE